MPSAGLRPIDVYFAARMAFLDLPDVRLRTFDDHARAGLVVEARSALTVVSGALDARFMFTAPAWAASDWARRLRQEFDYHEAWARTHATHAIEIRDMRRVG